MLIIVRGNRSMIMIKKRFLLIIGLVFIVANFLINYIPVNNFIIITMIILGWLSVLFLNMGADINLTTKKEVLISIVAFIVEVLIILISAFIFESGLLLDLNRPSLWENNKVINLYAITGIFVIKEVIRFFISQKNKSEL